MGVYIRNITKEQFIEDCNAMGVLVITEGISEIDLVRCGECIYRHEHEWYNTCDKHIGHGFEDDYFCKDGERRADCEDETDEEWYDWRDEQEYEDRWERRAE